MDTSKGKRSCNTDVCLPAKPEATCNFCKECGDSELLFGKFYRLGRVNCHHFCLLLSSQMLQNGMDDEGILGFLYEDIVKELRRAKSSKCYYCGCSHSTLSCQYPDCKKTFHLPCGRRNGALNMFSDKFQSYCKDHRPMQRVPVSIFSDRSNVGVDTLIINLKRVDQLPRETSSIIQKIQDPIASTSHDDPCETESFYTCAICYDDIVPYPTDQSVWPECCRRDKWLHRICVARFALSSGKYHVRCPLCNNQPIFLDMIHRLGFYVPDQDASWELENGAYQELLERPKECFREDCLCPKGSTFSSTKNGPWKLIICGLCGSQGVHRDCHETKGRKGVVCNRCLPSPNHQTSNLESLETTLVTTIDVESVSDLSDSESEGENVDSGQNSNKPVARRLPNRYDEDSVGTLMTHALESKVKISSENETEVVEKQFIDVSNGSAVINYEMEQNSSSSGIEENKLEIISSLSKMLMSEPNDYYNMNNNVVDSKITSEVVLLSDDDIDNTQTHSIISQLSNTIKIFNERNRTRSVDSGLDLQYSISDVPSQVMTEASLTKKCDDNIAINLNVPTDSAKHATIQNNKKNTSPFKKSNFIKKPSRSKHVLENDKAKIISKRLNRRNKRRNNEIKAKIGKHSNRHSIRNDKGKFIKPIDKVKQARDANPLNKSNDVSVSSSIIDITDSKDSKTQSNESRKHSTETKSALTDKSDKYKSKKGLKKSNKWKNLKNLIKKDNKSSGGRDLHSKKTKEKIHHDPVKLSVSKSESKIQTSGNLQNSFKKSAKKKASAVTWVAGKPRNGVNVVLKNGKFCILNKDGQQVKVKELIEKQPKQKDEKQSKQKDEKQLKQKDEKQSKQKDVKSHAEGGKQTDKSEIKRKIKKSTEGKVASPEVDMDLTKISIKVTSLVKRPKNKLSPEKGQTQILSFFKKVFDTFEDAVRMTDVEQKHNNTVPEEQQATTKQNVIIKSDKHARDKTHTRGKKHRKKHMCDKKRKIDNYAAINLEHERHKLKSKTSKKHSSDKCKNNRKKMLHSKDGELMDIDRKPVTNSFGEIPTNVTKEYSDKGKHHQEFKYRLNEQSNTSGTSVKDCDENNVIVSISRDILIDLPQNKTENKDKCSNNTLLKRKYKIEKKVRKLSEGKKIMFHNMDDAIDSGFADQSDHDVDPRLLKDHWKCGKNVTNKAGDKTTKIRKQNNDEKRTSMRDENMGVVQNSRKRKNAENKIKHTSRKRKKILNDTSGILIDRTESYNVIVSDEQEGKYSKYNSIATKE